MKILFTSILCVLFMAAASYSQPHVEQGGNPPRLPQAEGEGWYKQNSGTAFFLTHIQFTSRDTGYVSGGGADSSGNPIPIFYRTTNGGSTWLSFGLANFGGRFFFLNHDVGWVFGLPNNLYYTENAGETWEERAVPRGKFKFFNKDTGWSVGGENWNKTTNGGKSWSLLGPGLGNGELNDLCVFDSEHMLGVGVQTPSNPDGCASLVYDSAGSSRKVPWCIQSDLATVENLNDSVAVTSGLLGTDDRPTVFITKTRGFSWEEIPHPWKGGMGRGLDFTDERNGTLVGVGGAIARTRDGGYTWEEQQSNTSVWLYSVSFIDSLYGGACGEDGTILHTSDAGKTWVKQYLPQPLTTSVSPEPFSRRTSISYELPKASKVRIRIYDILGKELEVIDSDGILESGTHSIDFNGSKYPEGTFYYRIETDSYIGTGKMTKIVY